MKVLNEREYGLLERIVSLSQTELKATLAQYLKGKYKKVIVEKEYIVAEGNIPVALVAHMDTVFYNQPSEIYYDQRKAIMWSPDGLGADDRAGIFAILQIIADGYRPHIILTTDEERGGLGAQALAKKKCPIEFLRFMIQLDRKGSNDCVFYECLNPEFIKFIEHFGFAEAVGSFSDISFLMPAWKICGVNLSIGYKDEHTIAETLNVHWMFKTISKVEDILEEVRKHDCPQYEFREIGNKLQDYYSFMRPYETYDDTYDTGTPCECCGKYFFDFELFPTKSKKKHKTVYYCPDCAVDKVEWCEECGHPYELIDPEDDMGYCPDCMEAFSVKNN